MELPAVSGTNTIKAMLLRQTCGYVAGLPVAPQGAIEWDSATAQDPGGVNQPTTGLTGYVLVKTFDGYSIHACESENRDEIFSSG
jgi:hypothetical protein